MAEFGEQVTKGDLFAVPSFNEKRSQNTSNRGSLPWLPSIQAKTGVPLATLR